LTRSARAMAGTWIPRCTMSLLPASFQLQGSAPTDVWVWHRIDRIPREVLTRQSEEVKYVLHQDAVRSRASAKRTFGKECEEVAPLPEGADTY
jgi:hypothetical protein